MEKYYKDSILSPNLPKLKNGKKRWQKGKGRWCIKRHM